MTLFERSGLRLPGALIALSHAQLMVTLNATVLNTALPQAQVQLGFSSASRTWIITAYALTFGSLMWWGGRVADHFGRRRLLIAGLIGFGVASLVGSFAHSFSLIVTARALQGLCGAVIAPAALATLSVEFEHPNARAKAYAIFGIVGATGVAVGVLLGGWLTQEYSWRACLSFNVFFVMVGVIGIALFIRPSPPVDASGDIVGTLLGSAGLFGVVWGCARAVETSWTNRGTLAGLGAGIPFLLLLWRRHHISSTPVEKQAGQRTRRASYVALCVTNFGMYGAALFLVYYLEQELHYTPVATGILFLPLIAAIAASAWLASARLLPTVGPRPLLPTGLFLALMGMVLFTTLPAQEYAGHYLVPSQATYVAHVVPGLLVLGLGLGLIYAPAFAGVTLGLSPRDVGAASASANVALQIGGSLGTSIMNTIAVAGVTVGYGSVGGLVIVNSYASVVHGYARAFWWAAGLFGVAALVTLILLVSDPIDFSEDS